MGVIVNAAQVTELVERLLKEYEYVPSESGTTVGTPWSTDKVGRHVAMLRQFLVPPYKLRFLLREGGNLPKPGAAEIEEYWVVAERPGYYLEWYDPDTEEFGLGEPAVGGQPAVSIGVRGDLVGVFCAM